MPLQVWQFDPAQISPYYNISLCEALATAGCAVRYVTSRSIHDDALFVSDQIKVDYHYSRLNPRLWKNPLVRKCLDATIYPVEHATLLREISAAKPDVFHIQWGRVPVFDNWLIERIKALGVRIVYTVHDIVPSMLSEAGLEQLHRLYAHADALIFHSAANREDFRRLFPLLPLSRMHVIPHLALNNALYPPGATRAAARERLNFPADAPIFLFFGTLRPHKGVDVLIDAFSRIVSKHPNMRLMVVGNPTNPRDVPPLTKLAGFQSNLYMRPEYIPFDEAWLYHLAADVIVFPYRSGYQSGALLTAMGYGRPVIVTDVGGMPETIDGNGWIVPPENCAQLADVMLEAISDRKRLEQMGQRSLDVLKALHDPAKIAQQTIELYESLGSARV
jgi:glycosyltransferase involved in cell wall biosynthesis